MYFDPKPFSALSNQEKYFKISSLTLFLSILTQQRLSNRLFGETCKDSIAEVKPTENKGMDGRVLLNPGENT